MKTQSLELWIKFPRKMLHWVAFFWGVFSLPHLAFAQIMPDNSLGSERSRLMNRTVHNQSADVVEGGAVRGTNLFHSFETFGIRQGQRVYFANPNGVKNIFSRITGRTHSDIEGTLGVEGDANLFLLNPNGIVFGRNASLDLRGSFLATTANSIRFANDIQFSATRPQPVPLLTVNVPIGLQFDQNPGSIINRSATQLFESGVPLKDPDGDPVTGLRVLPAQTLALVGGDIRLQRGGLVAGSQPTAPGGRIELGSVTGSGSVSLTPITQGWSLNYRGISTFGEISLSQGSSVNTSGSSGGATRAQARQISLDDSSIIFSVTQGGGSGEALTLNASEQILLNQAFILTRTRGTGSAGNIRVVTPRLIVRSGSTLGSATSSDGQGGDVTITTSDTVVVDDGLIFAQTCDEAVCGKGASGNLTLTTGQLLVEAGGQIITTTIGEGQGGNLFVQARTVNLNGIERDASGHPVLQGKFPIPSGLYAGVQLDSKGNGGEGNGGDLTLETQRLSLRGGAVLYTGTFGSGNAGRLTIHAAESVEISGAAVDINAPTSLAAYSGGLGEGFPSVLSALGAGNNIYIETGEFIVRDGGQVGVSSINRNAPGAGTITIDAPLVRLNNGTLSAQTASGNGARIQLGNTNDIYLLLMQNHSRITTNAGLNGGEGTGGNIDINAKFAVTSEYEDSDITANARQQDPGNVTFNANTTGFTIGNRLTPYSDITAFSEQGITGKITISSPQVNPTQGLIDLPNNLVDRSTQIARGCTPRGQESGRFVVTGRGGLPLSPDEALHDRTILSPDWVTLNSEADRSEEEGRKQAAPENTIPENVIVEADGLGRDMKGKVILVARSKTASVFSQTLQVSCINP